MCPCRITNTARELETSPGVTASEGSRRQQLRAWELRAGLQPPGGSVLPPIAGTGHNSAVVLDPTAHNRIRSAVPEALHQAPHSVLGCACSGHTHSKMQVSLPSLICLPAVLHILSLYSFFKILAR